MYRYLVDELGIALSPLAVWGSIHLPALSDVDEGLFGGRISPGGEAGDPAIAAQHTFAAGSAGAEGFGVGAMNEGRAASVEAKGPDGLAIGGHGRTAGGPAGMKGLDELLVVHGLVEIDHGRVEAVLEIAVVENRHPIGADGHGGEGGAAGISAERFGFVPLFGRRHPGRCSHDEPGGDGMKLSVNHPFLRGHVDALQAIFARRHWHEVVVEAVPGVRELALILGRDGAWCAADELADDPVGILRINNGEGDQISSGQFSVGGQLVFDGHPAPSGAAVAWALSSAARAAVTSVNNPAMASKWSRFILPLTLPVSSRCSA